MRKARLARRTKQSPRRAKVKDRTWLDRFGPLIVIIVIGLAAVIAGGYFANRFASTEFHTDKERALLACMNDRTKVAGDAHMRDAAAADCVGNGPDERLTTRP